MDVCFCVNFTQNQIINFIFIKLFEYKFNLGCVVNITSLQTFVSFKERKYPNILNL